MRTLSLFSLVLLCVVGCSRQKLPDGMPKPYPVTMTVTQDGKPLADAMVLLSHVDGQWPAQGVSDSNGVIKTFYTNSKYPGVVAGQFKVCVRKVEKVYAIDPKDIPPEPTDLQEKYAWRMKYQENRIPPKEYDLVETNYADPKTTPLELEVSSDKKNNPTFDVGKAVKILYTR